MKIKTTKRAFIASALSLLLCASMLIGTTFAWFTDNVKSGINTIQSGNLDVELYYSVMGNDGKWTEYAKVTSETDVFGYNLWEPGYTAVAKFKIVNKGSLALKYQLTADVYSEKEGINKDGDKFLLSEYLKYGVTENVDVLANRTSAAAFATADFASFQIKSDSLEAGKETELGMVITMPTTVDNKANHNGNDIPEITFGINLIATQLMSENDSFGNDYDEDAVFGTYIELSAGADLLASMASAKKDMPLTIKLMGDVEWPTEGHHGENDITPASSIVIDGNGNTITATGAGVTPLGDVEAPMTLKNVKIVDKSVSYNEGAWEFTYLEMGGTNLTCENVTFADEIQLGTAATFSNCSFESNEESVYAVWVEAGSATFTNCTFTGSRGLKMHEDYGSEINSVVVKNCAFTDITKKPGIAIGDLNADTTVVITNNTFAGTQAGDQGLYSYETDTDVTTIDFVYADNIVAGYADTNTELEDALKNGATVVLPTGEYTLPSMSDKEGVTIIGAADGSTVIGGENTSTGFGGNFGKDTTIKNVTFSGSTNGVRYSYAKGGNTVFENCTFAGDSIYGFHIDQSNGATFTFNNCTFIGFNAFAGDLVKVTFNSCTFLSNGNYGHTNIWSVGEFNNCTWGDNTSVSPAGSGKLYFDGVEESYHHEFIGSAESLLAFAKSVNEGNDSWKGQKVLLVADIDLENAAWTPIGQTGATEFRGIFDGQNYTIKNLNVDNSAYTDEHTSTGLFGWAESGVTIQNVKVDGATMKGNHNVAVIVGYTYSGKIINCHVSNATVVCTHANGDACGDKAGIIAGYTADEARLTDCTASDSTVKAGRDAGQLFGLAYTNSVSNCSATNVVVSATGDCNREGNINNAIIGRVMG